MGLEIERKFLLKDDTWKAEADNGLEIKQGYLSSVIERTVRVRVIGGKGVLTVKGKTDNLTRKEFEYEIPFNEAISLLDLCETPIIEKKRYLVKRDSLVWEIDIFEGENEGLKVVEVELDSESQSFELPDWAGNEVSKESKYYNSALIANPFKNWK